MNDLDKTREELVIELEELCQAHDQLKTSYKKVLSERKQVDDIFRFVDESGVQRALPEFLTSIRSGKTDGIHTFQMNRKNGSAFTGELSVDVYREDGQASGTIGVIGDFTERNKAEEALVESEAHFRNLVEKLPDGVYKSTHDGKFVDVNPAMVTMLGYGSKEELLGIDIKTQLYFDLVDRESVVLHEKLKEIGIYRMKKKDGSEIWVEDHGWLNFDEKANILFHEGIMMDISERLKTEKILKESEKKYRNLFENAQEGIFQTNVNGTHRSVNPALAKMYGFESPEELINTRTDISKDVYFDSTQRDYFLKMMEEYGFVKGWEYEVKHKDGHKIWLYENAQAIKDEDGKIQYFEGFVVDITERKMAEIALNESLVELKKFNNLMVGREIRMIDLKQEINELLKKAGEKEKYTIHK